MVPALAFILALMALLAAMPPVRLPLPRLGFVLFIVSVTGQINALPLTGVALLLAWLARGWSTWLFVLAACLFAFVHWRNRLAGRVLLDAVGLSDTRIPPLAGLAPFLAGTARVRRIEDLRYGDHDTGNRLDLILPQQSPEAAMPVLVHVHGGGWSMGGKGQQAKPLLNHLAARGWLCADVAYRLGPGDRMPAMIVDVLKAIAWLKAEAPGYGGDPTRVAITGGSAGGHLAMMAALAHDDPRFKPGFESADCAVAAAIPVYGVYDLLDRDNPHAAERAATLRFLNEQIMPEPLESSSELWRALSPRDRLRPDVPPTLVIHGTGDALQPVRNARAFAAALRRESRQPVLFVELAGIEHAFDMGATALTWAHTRAVEAFLAPLAEGRAGGGGDGRRTRLDREGRE